MFAAIKESASNLVWAFRHSLTRGDEADQRRMRGRYILAATVLLVICPAVLAYLFLLDPYVGVFVLSMVVVFFLAPVGYLIHEVNYERYFVRRAELMFLDWDDMIEKGASR